MAHISKQKTILALSVGSFGRAVVRHLRATCNDVDEIILPGDSTINPDGWPKADSYIIASWRPVPKLCKIVADISDQLCIPFFPVIVESRVLKVGPVTIPQQVPCWDCWIRREKQHTGHPKETAILLDYYSKNDACGPIGYLEPFAMVAAAAVSRIFHEIGTRVVAAGYIWQIDIITRDIITGTVAGIHGCLRCGMNRPPETRSISDMRDWFQSLNAFEVDTIGDE